MRSDGLLIEFSRSCFVLVSCVCCVSLFLGVCERAFRLSVGCLIVVVVCSIVVLVSYVGWLFDCCCEKVGS